MANCTINVKIDKLPLVKALAGAMDTLAELEDEDLLGMADTLDSGYTWNAKTDRAIAEMLRRIVGDVRPAAR